MRHLDDLDNTHNSFTNVLPDQVNFDGQWGLQLRKFPTVQGTRIFKMGNLFYDPIYSKTTTACCLEPGLYSCTPDIVEAMNLLIQEKNNHNENCITVKESRRTLKIELSFFGDDSSLVIFSTYLGNIFGGDVGDDKGILMRGKGPHEPTFAYDIVRIHSLMIHTDIVEYNVVGDTKAPLLRCFQFQAEIRRHNHYCTMHELQNF